ncbi:MAG: recombinase family protein [Cellulosilyticum sp.]|nr:recombinase family protein [Cellulosilyticum sp.]
MSKIYGYCRISKKTQSIERQQRNILTMYPNAIIINEVFTGTKIEGRKELNKLLKKLKESDTVVFDSVSRMSRDAESGFKLYKELFEKGVNLIFLKEGYINTIVYKEQLSSHHNIKVEDKDLNDTIMQGIREYLLRLAEKQIQIAFQQSEKEVMDLRQRTKEGIETARRNGKQIGQIQGTTLVTKKSIQAKGQIRKHCRDFGGSLNDSETMKLAGVSRNSYYKYKKQLEQELVDETSV